MGCDIHLCVERKAGARWVSCDTWEEEDWGDGEPYFTQPFNKRAYGGRNYDLFAMLANVRNGYGFAGCDTGDGFVPICQPKGLPEDASPEVKRWSDQWGEDGHSHSWLTVKEIEEYDLTQKTKQRGVLSAKEYEEFKASGKAQPDGWSGAVMGKNIVTVSAEQWDRFKGFSDAEKETLFPDFKETEFYVQCDWPVTYRECASHFFDEVLPKIKELDPDPENVRIVFWFDN